MKRNDDLRPIEGIIMGMIMSAPLWFLFYKAIDLLIDYLRSRG